MVVLASGPELSLLRRCGGLEASTEPWALKCRCPGRAVVAGDDGRRSAACGRLPVRCLDLEQDDAGTIFSHRRACRMCTDAPDHDARDPEGAIG